MLKCTTSLPLSKISRVTLTLLPMAKFYLLFSNGGRKNNHTNYCVRSQLLSLKMSGLDVRLPLTTAII